MTALELARTLRELDVDGDFKSRINFGLLAWEHKDALLDALCVAAAVQASREEYEADQGDDGFKQPDDLYGIMQRAAELKASLETKCDGN